MKLTSFEDSIKNLKSSFDFKQKVEYVGLMEAFGRVLAQDIIAKENMPKFATSAMDGYAIKFEDQQLGRIKIKEHLPAGAKKEIVVENGECVKTFTGSLISDGADTLIPIENVCVENDEIIINKSVQKGFSIRESGENYKKGEILIQKGSLIKYAQIGVLAELGIVSIPVVVKPKVAILATGSEIVDIGEALENEAQIRSSNHVTLAALAKEAGCEVILLGLVKDNESQIKAKILEGLSLADIVLTSGGVSVGDYDFVKDALQSLKSEFVIDKANIKPGRHIRALKVGEKYIFAMPGFPYSAIVCFRLYVLPTIQNMQGIIKGLDKVKAKMRETYHKRSIYTEFTACNLSYENGEFWVDLQGKKQGSSAILNNMLKNAALLCVPDVKTIEKGEIVEVLLMSEF